MATRVVKEVFLKAFADVAANNPGLFVGYVVGGTNAVIGGTIWFGYDAKQKQWDRESNAEIAKYKIEADTLLSEHQILIPRQNWVTTRATRNA